MYILVELVERWLTMREVPRLASVGKIAFFEDKIYHTVTLGVRQGKCSGYAHLPTVLGTVVGS
jgi:hypothetical protein